MEKMTMKELLDMGYTVTYGTVYGDKLIAPDDEDLECYEDAELVEIDHEAKTAYFYEDEDWESYGEDL